MSRTAVILAGGRGERMIPITNTIPKALVPINGIPILEQQLRQLEKLGFSEVLILTGYLSNSVKFFCEKFTTLMKISCIESDASDSPRQRLLRIKDKLFGDFLLIYCDNFIQSDLALESVMKSESPLTFLIEPRQEGNIDISQINRAVYFSGTRTSELKFVELGNIKVSTESFFEELAISRDLPRALENISKRTHCNFYIVEDALSSVSTFPRFIEMEKNRFKIILDRDGVLIGSMPKREYVTKMGDYKPLWGNWRALRQLSEFGCDFIVATNQPGVALKQVSADFLLELHQKLAVDLMLEGVNVLAFYVCTHHWEDNCECRKPRPGMLLNAMKDFQLSLKETIYIGDDDKDLAAAQAAGLEGILIGENHTNKDDYLNLAAAVPRIKGHLEQIR